MRGGTIIGVGYEGRTIERVVRELVEADVRTLVDVRLNPLSRKPGFSKRALNGHLAAAGIDYLHLPALGNPRWNRPGFAGSTAERDEARSNYRDCLSSSEAARALDRIRSLAATETVAVLCFEADEERCHRSLVLEEAASLSPFIAAAGSRLPGH